MIATARTFLGLEQAQHHPAVLRCTAHVSARAVGQSVVMTFTFESESDPALNACANDACFPALRNYDFTNTVPGTGWITTTDSIGGITVPEFAPNGGNVGSSDTSSNNMPMAVAFPSRRPGFKAIPRGRTTSWIFKALKVVQTMGANGAYTASTETSFLRLDDATATPFLSSLLLDQNFAWSSNLDDGGSIAQISRGLTCGNLLGRPTARAGPICKR